MSHTKHGLVARRKLLADTVKLCRLKMPHQTFLELSKNCGVRFQSWPRAQCRQLYAAVNRTFGIHCRANKALFCLGRCHASCVDTDLLLQRSMRAWGGELKHVIHMQAFTEKSMEFQTKIIERSGLGDETYLPDGTPAALACTPLPCSLQAAPQTGPIGFPILQAEGLSIKLAVWLPSLSPYSPSSF